MKRALLLLLAGSLISIAGEKIVRPGVPAVQVKMTELKPANTFTLGGSPDWMALTDDSVWISNARLKKVQRTDPAKNTVAGEVTFSGAPCSGLVAAFGSLWVPICAKSGGSLARVDLKTGKIISTLPFAPGESEGGITASQHSVWIVTDNNGTLLSIDPTTNQMKAKISVPAGSFNPLFADGLIWVTGNASNELAVVDPASAKVLAKIPVGPKPRFLTASDGAVWTLNQGDGSVTRVDTKTKKVVATIAAGIPGPGGEICSGAGSIWTTVFDIPLSRIDAATNKVVKQWTGPGGDSVRFGFGSIWLTDLRKGLLWRFDQID
jgi:YVTN family beta-propeller protein